MSSIITSVILPGLGPVCPESFSRGHIAALRLSPSGAGRTLRYPPDRCLACQRRLDADAAVQEATLTIYEPSAVLAIRFRVCQPCALNLDPHADAPRLRHLVVRHAAA